MKRKLATNHAGSPSFTSMLGVAFGAVAVGALAIWSTCHWPIGDPKDAHRRSHI